MAQAIEIEHKTLPELSESGIDAITKVMMEFASGNLSARAAVSPDDDKSAALAAGINMLGEELQERFIEKKKLEKQVKQARENAESITASMSDAVIVVNPDSSIESVNPAACNMLGYTPHELKGMPIGKLFKDDIRDLKIILEMIQDYVDKAGIGFVQIDRNAKFVKANQWFMNMIGNPPLADDQLPDPTKTPMLSESSIAAAVNQCLEHGEKINFKAEPFTDSFGNYFEDLNLRIIPVWENDEYVSGVYILLYDAAKKPLPDLEYWEK
ncbi:MAG: hypothetical protein MAG581_02201 [Deltaproteobacteria bacterium]|jgi:hypothetical protein|nr:hypothetical protein [Deltaproteobacteria bacterium]